VIEPSAFAGVIASVAALDEAAATADGHPSLGEAVWRDLDHPGADSGGIFVRADDDAAIAYAHVARTDNFAPQHWAIGSVVHPAARDADVLHDVIVAALAHVAAHGGGPVELFVFGGEQNDDALLAREGFEPSRVLYEMRVPLPLAEQPRWPEGVEVRTFEPGRDEEAWLALNNRAFANHPDQGGWIAETLQRRMAERWFDPTLFLLAEDADGLVGSNWLKIHDAHGRDPRLGEIFVIGVDPRAQGTGLGRALAVEGLHRVHAHGVDTGSLFTDASNEGAVRLYGSLGFVVHRTDRAYETTVPSP
jgi:mycothiol synthase